MTFSNLFSVIIKRIWLPILFAVLAAAILLTQFNRPQFGSTVTVGMPTNGQGFSLQLNYEVPAINENQSKDVSVQSMQTALDTSVYLSKRYQAIDVQAAIAKKMGISTNNLSSESPFYTVNNQGFGYVNVSFQSANKSEVDAFQKAVQETHAMIVDEWNTGRNGPFLVEKTPQFPSTQYQIDANIQSLFIPVLAVFLLGCVLIILWPVTAKK